ncbi:MAG: pilus assembly protein [Phycisphaerales bacterium]|jgi:Flp pilus assembly protein TadG|nr:pilus assembly protein [Phycisphaerales bacterium]
MAMVEAALVFPLLLMLTFGLIEYAWLFLRVESISNAARRGVRVAVTPDATCADVSSAVASMMSDTGLSGSNYTVTVSNLNVEPGQPVTVHIVVPDYDSISLTGSPMIPVPAHIERRIAMVKEGP